MAVPERVDIQHVAADGSPQQRQLREGDTLSLQVRGRHPQHAAVSFQFRNCEGTRLLLLLHGQLSGPQVLSSSRQRDDAVRKAGAQPTQVASCRYQLHLLTVGSERDPVLRGRTAGRDHRCQLVGNCQIKNGWKTTTLKVGLYERPL